MPPSTTRPSRFGQKLLWVDCAGAALAGVVVLVLGGWLSQVEGLPRGVLLFTGAANVAYAAYSFSLAVRPERPMVLIKALVLANLAWSGVCVGLLAAFSATATPFALLHLGGEAVYVGGLATLEWRHRDLIATAA